MNYEAFVQEMFCCAKNELSPDECMEIQHVLKNNGVTHTGLSIRHQAESIAPVFYLDEYYERYRNGECIADLSREFLAQRINAPAPPVWDYKSILDFNKIQNQVVVRLVNRKLNEKLLQQIPHFLVFDLAIIFYIIIPYHDGEECSILIRNSHMNLWDIQISVLYETARGNTMRLYPYIFQPLGEYIESWNCQESFDSSMWILTNLSGNYGASVILYPHMLKRIYEKLGHHYFLLPASVHEFLVVPAYGGIYPEQLCEIICEVNETQVEKEEVLGECVYYFDGKNITKI